LLDKWSAAATGKPQTIFDEDCDEVYPSANASWTEVMDETDDDIDGPRFPSLDSQLAQHIDTAQVPVYQPFVQLCKLTEILSKILQYLYTPQAKRYSSQFGSDKIISHLDKALSEWRLGLPPGLQLSSINVRRLEGKKTTPLISVSGLIYLSYCTLLILLHRPFIEKDSTHSSALNICVSAAIRCIDIAEKMNYSDFFLASWSFAIYPIFTASLVHIYNTSNPDIIVSDVAKSNLIKLFKTVKKLTDVSQGAIKLKTLLTEVLKEHNMDIPLEENEEDSEPSTSTNNTGSTEWQKERPAINKRLSFIPHPFNTNVESEMSKCFTENPILSCTSAPHPHLNENWINELSYSLKTTPVGKV
jgi:hypothetical protein